MNTGIQKYDDRSARNIAGVHPALVAIIERASKQTAVKFCVTEGVRSAARQYELVKAGASQTLSSRHLTGHAVDLAAVVDGQIRWDWPLYERINEAVQRAATELGKQVIWGGSWRKFKDGPHFELPRLSYLAESSK